MSKVSIVVASDHAGYSLKQHLLNEIDLTKIDVIDCGTNSQEPVDYPDLAKKVIDIVSVNKDCFGILICHTGIGMSIAANKRRNIRAALCNNIDSVELARKHNNSNILVLGASVVSKQEVNKFLEKFLSTDFEGERHLRRVNKIDKLME